jgi:methionyl-tRNA formyltransferase
VSSRPVRTIFLGSGQFAVPILAAAAEHRSLELAAVVTAPPRPVGRRQEPAATPVGEWAAERGLPLLTPGRLRDEDSVASLRELSPELLVLADYGQIVPQAVLELPRHGALNLHPSLLPRHRGAAPIQAAILAGDDETGVTLMLMDAGLDSGPIVAQAKQRLVGSETAPDLEELLAIRAAELLGESLPGWLTGSIPAHPQPSEGVTMTRPLRREDGRLDASTRPASEIERRVRALQPWPGTFLDTPGGRLVIRSVRVDTTDVGRAAAPGALVALEGGRLGLRAADGVLELVEVQPAGGRPMSGADLLRGRPGLLTVR